MDKNIKLLYLLQLINDENLNLAYKSSMLSMAVSMDQSSNNNINEDDISQLDEIMMNKIIGNLDRTTLTQFPIKSSARRMLQLDNNCSNFQNSLANIFGIEIESQKKCVKKPDIILAPKKSLPEKYPKKRAIESIDKNDHINNNGAKINDNEIRTEFKTASGKNWDAENNNNLTVKKPDNHIESTTGANRKRLGLSKINTNSQNSTFSNSIKKDNQSAPSIDLPEIKGIEPKMVELILNEILDKSAPVDWDDVAGLEFAKDTIKEIIIWPMLRPDIFTGLRGPPKGILLFGPPGTGKTLIGKCIASKSKATFFSISASSLTSKWVGEGEKMVRSLFAVAKYFQPSVIFIDEIDSLLTHRCDGEHESSRRIKTEFLVQLDGCGCFDEERILVIGATNRPQELDEAARRRLVKKLYIPLPDLPARKQIISNLLKNQSHNMNDQDIQKIVEQTDGYSGADVTNLCKEAAIAPLRSIMADIATININDVPPITLKDFEISLKLVKSSVSKNDLQIYHSWNEMYGNMTI